MELTCGQQEGENHQHDVICYSPVKVLICGQEENELHQHTDECYETPMHQICFMEEGEGAHHHTEECYERVLTCDKLELPEHIHGPECFRTEEMTEEEIILANATEPPVDGQEAEEGTEQSEQVGQEQNEQVGQEQNEQVDQEQDEQVSQEQDEENLPAAEPSLQPDPISFAAEAENILVTVEAPADAFPAGTEMKVTPIYDEQVLNEAADAVEKDENIGGNVVQVQAVDISFWYEGMEIEPGKPIRVVMTPVAAPEFDTQAVVHVDNTGEASVIEQEDEEVPEASFEVENFSVYCLVYIKIETTVLASDGNNYKITVTTSEETPFPENATLWVSELERGSNAYGINYNEYLTRTEYALGLEAGSASYVRMFDIFVGDQFGNKLSVTAPVDVKIELLDKKADEESKVVHFGTRTEVVDAETDGQTVSFEANGFSVYAIVGTIQGEITITSPDGVDVTYVVSVTYGPEAEIPEGASLQITEFAKDSEAYLDAYNKVIEYKTNTEEGFFEEGIDLDALDIKIVDAAGGIVEPKAAVQVNITRKELPEDIAVEDLEASLEVQHIVENDSGTRVEVVATPGDEKNTVAVTSEEKLVADFTVESFSTFTISWNRTTNYDTTTLRWRSWNYGNYTARGYLTARYRDESGNAITRPNGIADTVNYDEFGDGAEHTFDIANDLGKTVENYTYLGAYVTVNGTREEVTSVKGERHGNTTTVTYYNEEGENVLSASYTGTGRHNFDNDGLVLTIEYKNNSHTTVHYGYMQDGQFVEFTQQPDPTTTSTSEGWAYLLYDFDGIDESGLRFEYEYTNTYYIEEEEGTTDPTIGTSVAPVLRYYNNAWTYYGASDASTGYAGYTGSALRTDSNWTSVGGGSHLYVVYEKPYIPNGGAPTMSEDIPTLDGPKILKQSVENGDGTNTLSLNIVGSTEQIKAEKLADVIVVLDLSSSMQNYIQNGNSTGGGYATNPNSRFYQAKQAVLTLANNLYAKNTADNPNLIRMGLVTFGGNAQVRQELTADSQTFLSTVNAITRYEGKGTNWEHALKLANEMSVDSGRSTFVIFITDGEPTTSQTRGGLDNVGLRSNLFESGSTGGVVAGDYNNHSVHYDTYYPMHFYLRSATFGLTNDDPTNPYNDVYHSAAHDDAKSIVDHNKNFYVITISNDVGTDSLNALLRDAGVPEDHGIPATNQQALVNAFSDIESKITGLMGWGDIQITDGITDLSNTVMESSSLFEVDNDFTYWKAAPPSDWAEWTDDLKAKYKLGVTAISDENPQGWDTWTSEQQAAYTAGKNATFIEWNPASENCAAADYDSVNEAVVWNMGSNFILEDGYTYRVSFTVWPSQDAYDWIADLENGVRTWQDVVAAGLNYPDGANPQIIKIGTESNATYSLKTNRPVPKATYRTAIKTGNNVSLSEDTYSLDYNDVDPMPLTEEKMNVKKEFAHSINAVSPFSKIKFTLMIDGVPYEKDGEPYTMILPKTEGAQPGAAGEWEEEVYIAAGLIKTISGGTPDYLVLETGHDFTVTEEVIDGDAYEYKLTAQIVRPMVIGTQLTYLVREDEYNVIPSGAKVYILKDIDGVAHNYFEPVANTGSSGGSEGSGSSSSSGSFSLVGTNRKTSELDITKKIIDNTGLMSEADLAKETFTYKITLTVPEGADTSGMMAYEYVPRLNDKVPGETGRPRFYIFGYQDEEFSYIDMNGETKTQKADDPASLGFAEDVAKFRQKVYAGWNAQVYNMFTEGSNTVTFYMTLDNDELIRLTNLPQGTTYTITEYYANVNTADTGAPSPEKSLAPNLAAQGYNTVLVRQDKSDTAVETETITGTISDLDKRYYNQFINVLDDHLDLELRARKHLEGYLWSGERYWIYLEAEDENNPMPYDRTRFYRSFPTKEDPSATAGDVDTDGYPFGTVRFTQPGTYVYSIYEDNPGQLVNGILYDTAKTVTIKVARDADNKLYVESVTGDDTTWDASKRVVMTTITNRRLTATIRKVDSLTKATLNGAEFELYSGSEKLYLDKDNMVLTASQVKAIIDMEDLSTEAAAAAMEAKGIQSSFTIGEITLSALLPDTTYSLKEIRTPDGYLISSNDATFTLSKNDQGKTVITVTGGNISLDEDGITILIENPPGSELPMTGGPGVALFETIGGIVMALAFAVLVFRKRRTA